MDVKKINFNDFGVKGKWNHQGIQKFIKEHSKPKTAIAVSVEEFYANFYNGTRKIKYVNYYCRKHTIDAMAALGIKGFAEVADGQLKIRFD